MTLLLGTKYCIESLLQDVLDVQETLNEVSSRVGQINHQSWKFPDKLSRDVDVKELVGDYQYEENDEEQNGISHVLLYDLLIDRLLYLLQYFTHFNEVLLDVAAGEKKSTSKSSSAGFTAKKCWSRVSQVALSLQHLARMKTSENRHERKSLSSKQFPVELLKENGVKSSKLDVPTVLCDVTNRSSQTDETSYISCEICHRTQSCLYDVGKVLVKVCKSQNLPSSLEDYLTKKDGLLSVAELTRWKNLQMKDLSRVDRQIEGLMRQINPLKNALEEAGRKEETLTEKLQCADVIWEKRVDELKDEMKHRSRDMEKIQSTLRKEVAALERENKTLNSRLETLDLELNAAKDALDEKSRSLRATESEKQRLMDEVMEGRQYGQDVRRLQVEMSELQRNLKLAEEKAHSSASRLEKEQLRSKTMKSHEQAMQRKQQALVERMAELNEECDELRDRLSEVEEDTARTREDARGRDGAKTQDNFSIKVEQLEGEKCGLVRRVRELEESLRGFESRLEDAVQRERLLVSYPDLHKSHGIQIIENSGDVYTDMRRQVEANELRIRVLEKENSDLRKTLGRLSPLELNTGSPREYGAVRAGEESPRKQQSFKPASFQLWNPEHNQDISLQFLGMPDSSSPDTSSASGEKKRNKRVETKNLKSRETQASPTRTSFSVGPGKRRGQTPSSRPSSGRSALLKPWT